MVTQCVVHGHTHHMQRICTNRQLQHHSWHTTRHPWRRYQHMPRHVTLKQNKIMSVVHCSIANEPLSSSGAVPLCRLQGSLKAPGGAPAAGWVVGSDALRSKRHIFRKHFCHCLRITQCHTQLPVM